MKYYYIVCLIYLVAINFVAFLMFGIDKYKARAGKWRIRESSLFVAAVLGGSIGALLGMRHFRHKTKHTSFVIGIPAILIAQIILVLLILH